MAACAAYGCTNRPSKKMPGVTFHSFPLNEQRKAEWVRNVRRKNWVPTRHSKLCSEHFTEEMMDRTSLSLVRLRENAVPTVFDGFPLYLKRKQLQGKLATKKSDPSPDQSSVLDALLPEIVYLCPASVSENSAPSETSDLCLASPSIMTPSPEISELCPDSPSTVTSAAETDDFYPVLISNRDIHNHDSISTSSQEMDDLCPTSSSAITSFSNIVDLGHHSASPKNPSLEEYKRQLEAENETTANCRKKIKVLQQKVRRQNKEIETLNSALNDVEMKKYINEIPW